MRDLPFRDALSSDDFVRMRLLDQDSNKRSEVKILRVSAERIELISPISVPPGTLIQLRYEGTFLLGEAHLCQQQGSTFQIGVNIQDTYRPNSAAL
jgi:hypothetical protein